MPDRDIMSNLYDSREGPPRPAKVTGKPVRLTVERLVHGGFGLARTDHGVVLVEGALPGETVDAVVTGTKSGTAVAETVSVLERSPSRREPPCPYASTCGGCDWLHLTYDAQVEAKQAIFAECLGRIGRIQASFAIDVYPSPETAYRRRTQFKVDPGAAIGFYRRRSNSVVPIDTCRILVPALNDLVAGQADVLRRVLTGVTQITAIAGEGDVVASSPPLPGLTHAAVTVKVDSLAFTVPGDGFFQGNVHLVGPLAAWAQPFARGNELVDIYGGVGLFAARLAENFGRTTLIESDRSLVEQARANLARNGLGHVDCLCTAAEEFCRRKHSGAPPDCVVVDPPRPGLTRTVREGLGALGPRQIVYVSCNPATQARDAGYLTSRCGYTIRRGALFDLYPQTHHLETVLLLERS